MSTRETEDKWLIQTYSKKPITIVRGEGVHVFDDQDKQYLDLYAGHAVCSVGHCHPKVVEAIRDQAGKLIFYSNAVYNDVRAEAAKMLCENAYPASAGVFFCNSGTEANETAIKIARRATGRSRIIAIDNSFHGRTIASLSVTGQEKLRADFPDNLAQMTDFAPMGDFDTIEALMSPDVAAIIIEPVQSAGGVRMASRGYYDALRELCTGNGTALIFDEVQTGFGRTGEMFAGMHWNIEPDMCTVAKAAAGGFPIGAVILNEAIAGAPAPGEHGCTFGGGPLAMAALKANLEVVVEEKLADNAKRLERVIRDELGAIEEIVAVTGKGLLLGVELVMPAGPVVEGLLAEGIIVGGSGRPNQLRLLPPLTITDEHVTQFVDALKKILPTVAQPA